MAGRIPSAAVGAGDPVVVCAGLWPTTGVASEQLVGGALAPLRRLEGSRRLIVLNRRSGMPAGMTMAEIAGEYADAIRADLGRPVDVVGMSTGGSIAQQLAADHPDVVRRLVLLSTACRLSSYGRDVQGRTAAHLRAGRRRAAAAVSGADLMPRVLSPLGYALGWAAGPALLKDGRQIDDLATTLEAEDGFDLARCARPIEAETLIVAGGRDHFYGDDLFRATEALIPTSRLWLFARRGHVSVGNDPKARSAIAGFLRWPDW